MSPLPTQIAHYRVGAKLGEGGMGAVYRATDTRLNRDVAIKVLPPTFADDPSRMARFEREAQVLATLNHPNIAAIYGVEQGAIVMELVEGEEIRGPLPLDTAIQYARQIAAGLEAAHEKGIVHRDLKPANIKVTPDGTVKLLDFGLAKTPEPTTSSTPSATLSPTMSMAMTQAGLILGTAAYMSPEQARGYPVDRRADIWAFGVVFFEMLSGGHVFGAPGETVTDIIADVVKSEPDWSKLPADTPPHIRRLLERCLRKNPKVRLRDIGEARIALDEPAVAEPQAQVPATARPRWKPFGWQSLACIITAAALAAGATTAWFATRPELLRPLMRLNVDLGADAPVYSVRNSTSFDISPDGTRLAVIVNRGGAAMLGVRSLQQNQVTLLKGTENAGSPFFSPDGEWIGFTASNKLKKVAVTGGVEVTLCTLPSGLRGASWADESSIVFATNTSLELMRVPAAGGSPAEFTKPDRSEPVRRWPQLLPEHQVILYTAANDGIVFDSARVVAQSLKTGERKVIVAGGFAARYLASGYLLYIHDGTLFAVQFDPDRLAVRGSAVPVIEGVRNAVGGFASYTVSRNGVMVYETDSATNLGESIVWLDASGKEQALHTTPGSYLYPRLSNDNRRLVFFISTSGASDLWVKDLQRDNTTRLTFTPGLNISPVWTPDGKGIIYRNTGLETGIYWIPSDGSGQAQRLLEGSWTPRSFSPDGRYVSLLSNAGDIDIYTATFDDNNGHPKFGKPEKFVGTPALDVEPMFSPDGKWIAYVSLESGRAEVYVRPFPGPGGKWQISDASGNEIRWNPKGGELFYESPKGIMVVPYTVSGATFMPGKPKVWTSLHPSEGGGRIKWDVAADGKRLVVVKSPDDGQQKPQSQLMFLLNFTDELKRKVK